MTKTKKRVGRVFLVLGICLAALALLFLFLQHVWPHRVGTYVPRGPQLDLAGILARDELTGRDYQTIYEQTGLGPLAVDDLLALGEPGVEQILATQDAFFHPPGEAPCLSLGVITREHRFRDGDGQVLAAAPLAPLEPGDILVSFSTHSIGWRHGHAGLVVDPDAPLTLESVVLGSNSCPMDTRHWTTYSTFLVLRPTGADDATRQAVVDFAETYLDGIPYSLTSGVFGDKFQPVDGPHDAQCAYLPWYAWMSQGVDLDGDGGKIVTPMDLATSDQVEVVQLYGVDPGDYPISVS